MIASEALASVERDLALWSAKLVFDIGDVRVLI